MTPSVLAVIDTEADDQWSAEGRERMDVKNAERLPALQALFDGFGVRPTYVLTWEMATRRESTAVLRDLAQTRRCEIGAHLHPWSSPPFRPEDKAAHTYPHNLPRDLLQRQLTELTSAIETNVGVRPTTYRAGRNGFDHHSLPILEALGYTVDTSVDPLFNERRKGGMVFAGAPAQPYHPSYDDVTQPGAAKILEIPITSATRPRLPKVAEAAYARLKPIPWRGVFKRAGIKPVWLRPSYSALDDMKAFASELKQAGAVSFNVIFHSSEILPGGSPYTPDAASVERFLGDLRGLLEHLTGRLQLAGRTCAEFAAEWNAAKAARA